jgi:hypothetical protein
VIELLVVTGILIKHRQLKEGSHLVKIPPLRLLQESLLQTPFHHCPHLSRLHKIMLGYQPINRLNRKVRGGMHLTEYPERDQPELGSHAQTRS